MRTERLARQLRQTLSRVWQLMELAESHGVDLPSFEVTLSVDAEEVDGVAGKTVRSWSFDRDGAQAMRIHTALQSGKPGRVAYFPVLRLSYPGPNRLQWLRFAKQLDSYLHQGRSESISLLQMQSAIERTAGRWGERSMQTLRSGRDHMGEPNWLTNRLLQEAVTA